MKKTLYGKLNTYAKKNKYPFHMPGHKRNIMCINNYFDKDGVEMLSPYIYDITEIEGFDNLHHPEEIIKERLEKISKLYGSKKSYYLVNGSTSGILSAIMSMCHNKKKLLMGRNSHKAAYNAVFTGKIETEYIYPDIIEDKGIIGGINPNKIEEELKKETEYGAVYITSPTYEGVVSDIEEIANICHKYGVPLIVDEAHGAHFKFHERFPKSALDVGADIVIQSLHKTMMSLTQTAILHIGKESNINPAEVENFLSIFQTSSPSYVLMASIDQCMDFAFSNKKMFDEYIERLDKYIKKLNALKKIKIINHKIAGANSVFDFDISKIVIYSKNNGAFLMERLRNEFDIEPEMASKDYVIAMTSVFDTDEGFHRLYNALVKIDEDIEEKVYNDNIMINCSYHSIRKMNIYDAYCMKKKDCNIHKSQGKISGNMISVYPPGIPVVVQGEEITKNIIDYIMSCRKNGFEVIGIDEYENISIIDGEK